MYKVSLTFTFRLSLRERQIFMYKVSSGTLNLYFVTARLSLRLIAAGCINVDLIQQCIAKLKKGKAPGLDGLMAEHILLACPVMAVHLSLLFNVLLTHGVVPDGFSRGVVIPLIENEANPFFCRQL